MPPWMDCVMLVNVYHPSIISGLTGWALSKGWHDLPGLTIDSLLSYPCPTWPGKTIFLKMKFVAPCLSPVELGKAIIFTVTWPSFSGWQALCTLTALCGLFPFSALTVYSNRTKWIDHCEHKASLIKQAYIGIKLGCGFLFVLIAGHRITWYLRHGCLTFKAQQLYYYKSFVLNSADGSVLPPPRKYPQR